MFFGLNDVAFLAAVSGPALDPDAAAYIAAVEAADTQALEPAVRAAINAFVVGCKADGIWSAIKASCILAGARTLTGALVPLVGAAPTNFNFVAGDYNRKTGLVGDGSTKYLNSNRNNNADPQDNNHNAFFLSTSGSGVYMGVVNALVPGQGGNTFSQTAIRNRTFQAFSIGLTSTGLIGSSRNNSGNYQIRHNGGTATRGDASLAPQDSPITIFRFISTYGSHRISFYSIGESLDLALLDARVTALINAFDAAI